jgi:hypothetical protein
VTASQSDAEAEAEVNESTAPVLWSTLIASEAAEEWAKLRIWVAAWQERFPHALRMPPCWWQHNDLVELLAALRDHERASYGASASPAAAVDWHRAFRELEMRMETWIKRFGCTVPGREHAVPIDEDGWRAFVAADVQARTPTADAEPGREWWLTPT